MSATRVGSDGWRARTRLASALGALAAVGPTLLAIVAAVGTARLLPTPGSPAWSIVWWATVVAVAAVAAWSVDRGARQLAPLRLLLGLTLVFPDRTPRRMRVARQAARQRPLADRIADGEYVGDAEIPPTAGGVLALVAALEAHDRFTRGHSERVRVNVDTLGEELGLSAEDRTKLSWAALVHDIGKLKVAEATLNETEQLSDEQWAELRRHPTLGRRLAAPLGPWLGPWIGAVTEHHERWDGGGYPAGLAGEEISLAGRITAVADTLEVLTAGRAYAPAIRPAAAREELVRCAGTQFDPKVVRAALRLSLGRRTAAAALLSTLAGIPIIGALVRVDRQAWQGAAVAGGLVVAVATGLIAPLARPLQPPPVAAPASGVPASPSDEPTVASPDLPSDGDAGAAPREAQPPSDTAEDGPAPTPTAAPSPTPAPSPAPAGGGEPSAPARHDEPVAGSWYLHPAVPAAHVAHASLPLASREPVTDEPVDADSDRGASPGVGLDDDRPTQGWETAVTSPTVLAGPLSVDVYAANPGLRQGSVELRVTVHRCGQDGACEQIAAGDVRGEAEPGGWTRLSASLEPTVGVLPVAGLLRVDLTRGSAGSEVWVAPASRTTPSAITLPALQPLGVLAVASATSLRHLVGRPAGPSCRDWPRRETTG